MSDDRLLEVVADLESRMEDMRLEYESRIDELEDELQNERDRRRELEQELAEVKETVDSTQNYLFDLDDSVFGEYSMGFWSDGDSVVGDLEDLEDRVTKVERGEVDASEVVAQSSGPEISELIPLHQNYLQATKLEPSDHDLKSNQEIAARSFPFLADQAMPRGDNKLVLKSPKVRDVIERKVYSPELAQRLPQVENPSRETVKRVMEFIDDFGKEMFDMKWAKNTGRNTNEIIIDRDKWLDYKDSLTDTESREREGAVERDTDPAEEADEILDAISSGQRAVTDGGGA